MKSLSVKLGVILAIIERKGEMKRLSLFIFFNILLCSSISFAGEVITATELQNCFYAEGKMGCSKGKFKNIYYRDKDKIVRTSAFNLKKRNPYLMTRFTKLLVSCFQTLETIPVCYYLK